MDELAQQNNMSKEYVVPCFRANPERPGGVERFTVLGARRATGYNLRPEAEPGHAAWGRGAFYPLIFAGRRSPRAVFKLL